MENTLEKNGTQTFSPVEQVNTELEKIGITENALATLKKYSELKVNAHIDNGNLIEDKESTAIVRKARIEVKNTRVLIEKKCKQLRDDANNYITENRKAEKKLLAILEPIETHLQLQESIPDVLQKQIDEENERKQEEVFKSRVLAIEEKLAKQKEEQEKERLRLEAIQKEQDEKAATLKAEQEKIEAEKQRMENERLAKIAEEKRLAELEVAKKEAAEKAIKDAQEKAKRDAEAKLESERIAKEKEERRLKRAPDKKLLKDFADNIMFNIAPPADEYLKSDEAKEIVKKAKAMFKDIELFVKAEIEKL